MSDSGRSSRSTKRKSSAKRDGSTSSRTSVRSLVNLFDTQVFSPETSPDRNNQKINISLKMESASTVSITNTNNFTKALPGLKLTTLTANNVVKVIKDFLDANKTTLLDWVNSSISFAGFDAEVMRGKIISKSTGDELLVCVLVGLVRGNNIDRIPHSMASKDAKAILEGAIKNLSIKKKVGGNYSAVTLSRMIACFPEIVADILYHHEIPMAIRYDELRAIFHQYPSVSRHQVCACLLPDTLSQEERNMAFNVIMVPYLMVSEKINHKNSTWSSKTPQTKFMDSSMYLTNSYNSAVLKKDQRMVLATTYGIITNDSKLQPAWTLAAEKAREWLVASYKTSF